MLAEVYLGRCRARGARSARWRRSSGSAWSTARASCRPSSPAGEQQRVAIARALAASPSLLLCDEPTGNLDSVNTETVLALFDGARAQDGMTMLLITHDDGVAERMPRRTSITDGQLTEHT